MPAKRVVVTGLGTTSPLGGDVASTWEAMLKGQSGVRHLTEDWAEQMPVKIAARVAVEPSEVLERVRARRLDRTSQFAVIAAEEAWKDSGLDGVEIDKDRLGVAIASGIGGVTTLLSNYDVLLEKGPRRVSPLAVPMLMPNAPAANVSLMLGARAAANTPVSACASGNEGISLALDQIRLGRADIILAGGTEAAIHPLPMAAFANMMALSKNDGDPTTVSRPWDTGRDGFVLGEGAGVLVLESEEHASARGARIYAEVLGAGITADAHDIAQPDPAGRGGSRAILRALARVRDQPGRHRPHQRPRHVDAAGRHRRGPDDPRDARRARQRRGRHQHQVDDRTPARWRRRARVHRHDPGDPPPARPADDQPRQPRPAGRARHPHHGSRAARRRHRGAEQLLRLRRRQRGRGLRDRSEDDGDGGAGQAGQAAPRRGPAQPGPPAARPCWTRAPSS